MIFLAFFLVLEIKDIILNDVIRQVDKVGTDGYLYMYFFTHTHPNTKILLFRQASDHTDVKKVAVLGGANHNRGGSQLFVIKQPLFVLLPFDPGDSKTG